MPPKPRRQLGGDDKKKEGTEVKKIRSAFDCLVNQIDRASLVRYFVTILASLKYLTEWVVVRILHIFPEAKLLLEKVHKKVYTILF